MGKLAVLMVTAFVDMVGPLMVLPLLPFYAKSLGAGGLVVGLLISSFALAQLIASPFWGRLSDRYGRRPALLIGLTASAIAYVVFAFANSLWLLFISRIVQGAGGGTVSVIQAYVADGAAPGLVAAALCLVNIVFAWRFLTESRDLAEAHAQPRKPGRSLEAVRRVV